MRVLQLNIRKALIDTMLSGIKQGGRSSSGNFTYPVAFSNVCSISIQKIGFHWAYIPRVTSYSNTALYWNYTDQADDTRNIDSFILVVGC